MFDPNPRRVLLHAAMALLLAVSALGAPIASAPQHTDASILPGSLPSRDDILSRRPWLDRTPTAAPSMVAPAGPDSLDANWLPGFGLTVPDQYITSLLSIGSVLVAGGGFRRIGALEAPGLAAWDGQHWSLLGEFPGYYVTDLAPYLQGFIAIGRSTAGAAVWQWTGTGWETWRGTTPIEYATALAVQGVQVAIAIETYDRDTLRDRVMLHTLQGWTTLGEDFDAEISALAWFGGRLYAGGTFRNVGAAAVACVAVWDGTSWQARPGVGPKDVRAFEVYQGALMAAGTYTDPSHPNQPRFIARWDGAQWSSLGSGGPLYPSILRLRAVGADLYVLGNFSTVLGGADAHGISRWDGTAWHFDEEHLQELVFDITLFQGELHAGGALSRSGDQPAPPLVRLEDGVWRATAPGGGEHGLLGWSGPVVQALAVTDRGIAAGGRFDFAGNAGDWLRCQSVALWDGERWESLGLEDWRFAETDGLATHQGVLYAIGSFADPSGRYGSVMQHTGAGWQLVGSGDDQPFLNANHGVSALGELFVGGSANSWDAFGGLARWDGSTWRDVGRGITRGSYIAALVEHGGELVVSGDFEEVGGVPCLNVAAWSPASGWHALGEGLRGYASALLSHDGVLYAAGMFRLSTSPGSATVGIARWRDGRWDALRAGSADQLGWYQGRLVASSYGWIATLEADSTWRPLGSGTNGRVLSMAEGAGTLYVGGFLSRAGQNPAYGFAAWREGAGGGEPQLPIAPAMSPLPNPFAKGVHLHYELPMAAHAKVEMFDLAGHRVDTVFDGPQSAGAQDLAWNPSAARVKAGVYFARLTIGVSTSVVSVVRVP